MNTDQKSYNDMVKKNTPPSRKVKNFFASFLVGGSICGIGQLMHNALMMLEIEEERVNLLVSVALISLSALLTALGLYAKLAKFSGAGSLVPITGYANAVASPAIEFKTEGWLTGVTVKMFSVAGPVIVFGLLFTSAVGAIYYVFLLWGIL